MSAIRKASDCCALNCIPNELGSVDTTQKGMKKRTIEQCLEEYRHTIHVIEQENSKKQGRLHKFRLKSNVHYAL